MKPQRLLIALIAGIATGFLLRWSAQAPLLALAAAVKPVGTLWLNALKMTLVPLVFAMVASGVAGSIAAGSGGRVIGYALALFATLLLLAVVIGGGVTATILHAWPTPEGALAGLTRSAAAHPALPSLVDQIVALVPTNPIAAAAQGDMTPLVLFATLFGIATTRISPDRRAAMAGVLGGITETMLVIVRWVIMLAPAGIFVLALGIAVNAGAAMAAFLAQGVVIRSGMAILGTLLCYPIAMASGVRLGRFARAAAVAQPMAAGTCSSLATLPTMIEAARARLGLPASLAGAVLPLAVSCFRFGTVACVAASVMLAVHAAGLHPSAAQWMMAALLIVVTNIGLAGLPAAVVLYAAEAPAYQLLGAPVELILLFIAVSGIADIFATTCNVTADLAVTSLVARIAGAAIEPEVAEESGAGHPFLVKELPA